MWIILSGPTFTDDISARSSTLLVVMEAFLLIKGLYLLFDCDASVEEGFPEFHVSTSERTGAD